MIQDEAIAALRSRPGVAIPIHHDSRETIKIPCLLPEWTRGIAHWIVDEEYWDQPFYSSHGAPEIQLEISPDGKACIFEDDESSVLLYTQLRGGHEIHEFLDFFQTATLEQVEQRQTKLQSLRDLVEGIYLALPDGDEARLTRFQWEEFQKKKTPFFEELVRYANSNSSKETLLHQRNFDEWVIERTADWENLTMCHPTRTDLIIRYGDAIPLLDLIAQEGISWLQGPHLIIRPRDSVSPMLLADFFSESQEAYDFVSAVEYFQWAEIKSGLKNITLSAPLGRNAQTATSLETRRAIIDYKDFFRRLSKQRAKFTDMRLLYQRRLKCLRAVHDDMLAEIESIQSPFPFFLEHPFRQFIAASDPLQKINFGQVLLNLLIKVPIFLVLEEAAEQQPEEALPFMDELRQKPLSDGSLIDIRRRLSSALAKRSDSVFQALQDHLADVEVLSRLVEARNRFHHPPFDDASFLEELSKLLPSYIAGLRPAFENLVFIVPNKLEFRDGKGVVSASNISGSNPVFPSFTFRTSLPLETFPSETLMCWSKDWDKAVRFEKLLTIRKFKTEAIDIGIFDRVRNNQSQFSFIREN